MSDDLDPREWRMHPDDVIEWIVRLVGDELEPMIRKAAEYGGADLEIMGGAMVALIDRSKFDPDTNWTKLGIEMGLAFYQLGKISRMFGAWAEGRTPSEDTLYDNMIYSLMLRFVRRFGHWRIDGTAPTTYDHYRTR